MNSVTRHASFNKHKLQCSVEMISPMNLNVANTPSFRPAMYGLYVTIWLELKFKGKIEYMETIAARTAIKRQSRRKRIIEQAVRQYKSLKILHSIATPTQDFMRIVSLTDSYFETSNAFQWVDIKFLKHCINTLVDQLSFIGIRKDTSIFEYAIQNSYIRGRCDIYDPSSRTVIEIKTCRFVAKDHFIQLSTYKRLACAKRAFLLNSVDGSIWKLIGS